MNRAVRIDGHLKRSRLDSGNPARTEARLAAHRARTKGLGLPRIVRLLAVLVLGQFTQPVWHQAKAAPPVSDIAIQEEIRQRLSKSVIGKDGFTARVKDGVVYWEGSTTVAQHKGAATRMAKSAGARRVVNNIRVQKSPAGGKGKAVKPPASNAPQGSGKVAPGNAVPGNAAQRTASPARNAALVQKSKPETAPSPVAAPRALRTTSLVPSEQPREPDPGSPPSPGLMPAAAEAAAKFRRVRVEWRTAALH